MDAFYQDLKHAWRGLLRTPGFTAIAIATLALGIGSNTAVFTVVRGVLFTPLPYVESDELMKIGGFIPGVASPELSGSPAELNDYSERARSFTDVTAVWPLHTNLVGGDKPVRVAFAGVHNNFFDVLGVPPMMGRVFRADEMHLGVGTKVVLSWNGWQRHFGGMEDIIGHMINIDGDPFEVVGVMPRGFHHPGQPLDAEVEMWGTFDMNPGGRWFFRDFRPLQLFARLAPGATIESARLEMAKIADELRVEYPQSYPEGSGWLTGVEPMKTEIVGDMEPVLLILFGAVGFVLLVACTNVAALLIARGAARSHQTAVKMALGGNRRAIMRFQLAESLLLAVAGGVVSVMVAFTTTGLLRTFAAGYLPRAELIEFQLPVLMFSLFVAIGTGLVFGMAPAITASLTNPLGAMNDGARGSSSSHGWLRDGLVVGEVAVSVILVVGSGLLIRSFDKLMNVDMGFDSTDIKVVQTYLPVQIDPNEGAYRQFPNRVRFYSEVIRKLEALPEVAEAGGVSNLPLRSVNGIRFVLEGEEVAANERPNAEFRVVSGRYFDVMSIPLLRGRQFTTFDEQGVPPVAVVNQAWVDRHAQGRDPIGMRFRLGNGNNGQLREIVGVVGNVTMQALDLGVREAIYLNHLQAAGNNMTFVFRTTAEPGLVLEKARQIVVQVDPDQPAFGMTTMDGVVATSVAERRVLMWMVSLFGVLALVLAGMGVFGVLSFRVRQRSREIGIRLALGATPRSVVRLVLGDGMRLGVIGVGVGMVGAFFSTRVLESMLFGVERFDPLVLAGVSGLALLVAVAGGILPARRAALVDPLETLKAEG
jgi:predicted permease